MVDRQAYLDDELILIRDAGELPEIVFHGALHYLSDDPDGPGLTLNTGEVHALREAVVARYRRIILRDLTPRNRDKRSYRGLARAIANWQRLCTFCERQEMGVENLRQEIADGLRDFLCREQADVGGGCRVSCVNCTSDQLAEFAAALRLDGEDLPPDWQCLCG